MNVWIYECMPKWLMIFMCLDDEFVREFGKIRALEFVGCVMGRICEVKIQIMS